MCVRESESIINTRRASSPHLSTTVIAGEQLQNHINGRLHVIAWVDQARLPMNRRPAHGRVVRDEHGESSSHVLQYGQ